MKVLRVINDGPEINLDIRFTGTYRPEENIVELNTQTITIKTDAVFDEYSDPAKAAHILMSCIADKVVEQLCENCLNANVDAVCEYNYLRTHYTTYQADMEVEEEEPED